MTTAVAEKPALITVVLYPERDRPQRNSPYRFPIAKGAGVKGGKDLKTVEMSLNGEFLTPGPNFLDRDSYEAMRQNPYWERCVRLRVIEVVDPQPESRGTGTTADFDLANAYTLIETSADTEWLKRSLNKDDRTEVQGWISDRLKEIEDQLPGAE